VKAIRGADGLGWFGEIETADNMQPPDPKLLQKTASCKRMRVTLEKCKKQGA
jgi:hypothetical protein